MNDIDSADLVVDDLRAPRRTRRLAVVTETYPPEVNGVSLSLARLVAGLQAQGHDVQLVRVRQGANDAPTESDADGMQQVLMRGMPIPRYPDLKMGLPAKSALVRLWRLQRPDLVHIATEGPLGWSALRAAQLLRLPVTSDFRTNFHAYSTHYGLGMLRRPILAYLRKFHNRTATTMVPTRALRDELAAQGFMNLRVVSRGVDTSRFHPGRRSEALRRYWGVQPDDLVVTCVGRLAAEKNLDLVVRAFEAIAAARPDARLLLVGDGPLREALTQRCPGAILAGQRQGLELAEHYASADLFLFASLTETFGNVVTEAMASGLPVLAYDCAAAAELIVDSVNGRVVAPGDDVAFVRAARRLAWNTELRHSLGQAARISACELDWARIVERFMTCAEEAIDASYSRHARRGAPAREIGDALRGSLIRP